MQSADMPLLFKLEFIHLWRNCYKLYYGQDTGKMYGLVAFSFNVQKGAGRNCISLTLFNFNLIASWNARYFSQKNVVEMPNRGPQVELRCAVCMGKATAMTPICEACANALLEKQSGRAAN